MAKSAAKPERTAIADVARHFSAARRGGSVAMSGKRIAVDVVAVGQKPARQVRPRLRFDRVVLRLMADLRSALQDLPTGEAVIVTVTAPIRLSGRTAIAIEERVRAGLGPREVRATVHGNAVRLRRVTGAPPAMPKVIGFVHNADTDPAILIDLAQAMIRQLGLRKSARPSGRWLVLADKGFPEAATYRQVWQQIATPAGYDKVLLATAGGPVDVLHG